jgi:hypothetical protein
MRVRKLANRGVTDKNPLIVSGEQVVPKAKDMSVMKKDLNFWGASNANTVGRP